MDSVLRGLSFLFVYLGDILVASAEEHLSHLQQFFEWLDEHGPIVNPVKCQFGMLDIDCLGHLISPQGAVPLPAKVETVAAFPCPAQLSPCRSFWGW